MRRGRPTVGEATACEIIFDGLHQDLPVPTSGCGRWSGHVGNVGLLPGALLAAAPATCRRARVSQ